MIKKLEKLVNLFQLLNNHFDPQSLSLEERKALEETTKKLIENARTALELLLTSLEKDVEVGKITNQETIQKIKEYRDKFNAL